MEFKPQNMLNQPFQWEDGVMDAREIPGFPGYYCDRDGNVYTTRKKGRHLQKFGPARPMRPYRRRDGYLQCHFRLDGNEFAPLLHQVVMNTWGPPKNDECINHKNGNKADNRIQNLEWVSPSDNVQHAICVLGKSSAGERHGSAKFNQSEIESIRSARKAGESPTSIGARFGITADYVYQIVSGKRWSHIP